MQKNGIAAVVINISRKLDKQILHYSIPVNLIEQIKIGSRVQVPLGKQACEGFVIAFPQTTEIAKLKDVSKVLDQEPIISQELVKLALWVSKRYLCPLNRVLEYILPPYARLKKEKMVYLAPQAEDLTKTIRLFDDLIENIISKLQKNPQKFDVLVKKYGNRVIPILDDLTDRGVIEISSQFINKGKSKYITMFTTSIFQDHLPTLIQTKLHNAPKQMQVLEYLIKNKPVTSSSLMEQLAVSKSTLDSLETKGLIKKYKSKEIRSPHFFEEFKKTGKIDLNPDQKNAVSQIIQSLDSKTYKNFLLHGVTGSGKTEVYLQCIQHALHTGKGVIVLVPEIALTPQMIGRFKSVLGEQVEVLHSGLSSGERFDVWQNIRSGLSKVVVGVRSAIFAPIENLGLIIMDEEHETTYKQSEPDPRYHARDVALERARINNASVVLGSATPAVESYHAVDTGKYQLIEMPYRVNKQPLPTIDIVDLRKEFQQGNKSIFSQELQKSIEATIAREEQIILFLNRRGYSTFVLCRECGEPLQCKNCEISLTYHTVPLQMKCHYCDFTTPVPKRCPNCGSAFIRYFGSGTQLVEAEIHKLWPYLKVTRMDVDTTRNKDAHQKLLSEFSQHKTNILLGTQMITKGLDFPNVTLVGVIAADTSLNLPDYTASEKTFQLITQVAGRAGRGDKKGKVIIQTYNPSHYAVIAGQAQDYQQFYQQEIETRQMMDYPPFTKLIRIVVSGFKEQDVQDGTEFIANVISYNFKQDMEMLGPASAPISKIKNRFRWQIILKGEKLEMLQKAATYAYNVFDKEQLAKSLRVIIDVEPQNIL